MNFLPYKKNALFILPVLGLLFCCTKQAAAQEEPRYYRFQYQKLHWRAYHSKKFSVYFPASAGDSLYRYIASEMPEATEYIRKAMLKELPVNLNIIIYPSVSKSYESNIGMYEIASYPYPIFMAKGNRVVIAFNGSYADLKGQLYEALVRALWESQLRSGEKEPPGKTKPKKGSEGGIPYWFKEGAIRYFAHGWPIEAEDKFRASFGDKHFATWQEVAAWQPRLAGQAFCYYISQAYYKNAIAQSIFQLKKKKSLPRAIRLVTKRDLDTLTSQCLQYYKARFREKRELADTGGIELKIPHPKGIVQNVQLSPGKDYIAYTILHNDKRTIYIADIKTGISNKIAVDKLPPWLDEHSKDQYPLLQWHKDGKQLYIAASWKGKPRVKRYTVDGHQEEKTTIEGIDGVQSFQALSDREFLLSAYTNWQSDIVSYNDNKGKFTTYTDDEYDDQSPVRTGDGNELLWVGNRPLKYLERRIYLIGVGYKKDTLWQGVYRKKDTLIEPVLVDTTGYVKYDKPVLLNDRRLLLTSTKNGEKQFMLLNYETGSTKQLGIYTPVQYLPATDEMMSYANEADSMKILIKPLESWIAAQQVTDTESRWLHDYRKMQREQQKEDSILNKGKDTTHYMMDDVFKSHGEEKPDKKHGMAKAKLVHQDGTEPYILQLHSAYFTAQVNNDCFINRYQPYYNYQGQFKFPEVGGMTKGGFTDLLENHHFNIAYRLPAATEGSDFNARYENTETKIDWGLSYFRKVETLKPDPSRHWVDEYGREYPSNAKAKTHYYEFFIRKPITFYSAISLTMALRQDRTVFLATDKYTLDFPSLTSAWSINTLAYKISRLKPTLVGLYSGFKAELFCDVFKGFDREEAIVFAPTFNIEWHKPLYKYITFVGQLHAGYSGGDEYILYNLGGVNNNVTPQADTSVHFAQNAPYSFQTLVTPFRGRMQNSLYGNQYLLTNADVYFPIFQTLIPLQTPLPFINNLQLGTFSDVATAKETWHSNIGNGKWLLSYGVSARTTLAGYPLRLDIAWPGSFNKQPVVYFSLKL